MSKLLGAVVLVIVYLIKLSQFSAVGASDIIHPPYFDDCYEEDDEGDYSLGIGNHTAPGLGYNVYGSNDIFRTVRLSYYQCLCTVGDNKSVQSNWWKLNEDVDQTTVDFYLSQGWTKADSADWNFPVQGEYLVRNFNYTCTNPLPITPTPTYNLTPTPAVNNGGGSGGAVGGPGGGDPSAPVCTDEVLGGATLVSSVKSGSDSVDIAWTSVSGATDYMIMYGIESGNYIYGVPSTGNVNTFRISGLDLNKKYYFQVRAKKGCMPGLVSNELSYPQSTAIGGQVLGLAATSGNNKVYLLTALLGLGAMVWGLRKYA